jgi:uncharacterized protein YdeI (YjbR/CyaY-like superfamily)
MDKATKIEAYFNRESPYREGLSRLREIVLKTELSEDLKWGSPVYTLGKDNVLGLLSFKHHFGIWFFNGVFLSDPHEVLENAQEGKTKAMRHWKFTDISEIDPAKVRAYLEEAIANSRKGIKMAPAKPKELSIPPELSNIFKEEPELKAQFDALAPYKKRDFAEYIDSAQQEITKLKRLNKILPLIREGIGLNDKYR